MKIQSSCISELRDSRWVEAPIFLCCFDSIPPQECKPKLWRSVVIQKENTLSIEDVQEEDSGNYTCELKFEGKLIRRTTELKVTGKGPSRVQTEDHAYNGGG